MRLPPLIAVEIVELLIIPRTRIMATIAVLRTEPLPFRVPTRLRRRRDSVVIPSYDCCGDTPGMMMVRTVSSGDTSWSLVPFFAARITSFAI